MHLTAKTSAAFRKEVWNWRLPQFANHTVPPEYASASSVVLARHVDLDASDGVRNGQHRKRGPVGITITEVTRELVKLNDAAAVKQYSEISYTALKKTSGYMANNSFATYLGVRIIKPDGTMKDIDADEVVLTKDEQREKQAKLAIPDLQPGDIIDYYIAEELELQAAGNNASYPYYFVFTSDEPVVSYSAHCEVDPKFAVEYKRYNGAPDFTLHTDDEGVNLLDFKATNLPVYPSGTIWLSPFREFPVTQLNIVSCPPRMSGANARNQGQMYRDQASNVILWDEFLAIGASNGALRMIPQLIKKSDAVREVYHDMHKQEDNMSRDSLAAALFYMFRYDVLFNVGTDINVSGFVNIAERNFSPSSYNFLLMEYFKENGLDAELLLSSSKFRPPLGEVLSKNDIQYLVNVPDAKSHIFGASDFYSCPFYVPAEMENAPKAVALDTRSVSAFRFNNATWHPVDIPATPAADNVHLEQLVVEPDLSGGEALKVARTTTLTGHYKDDTQKQLLLLEDFYNYERKFFHEDETLVEKFANMRRSKNLSEELGTAFAEARKKQKDLFLEDAKDFFDLEVTGLSANKILNPGVRHTSPAFTYAADMNLQGALKHAGNNYIVEIGKLSGSPVKIEEKHRERKLDIYAPFARTMRVEIKLNVPEGYKVEGLENLSRSVSNEHGSFTATATLDGHTLTVITDKKYNKGMEPAAAWPGLLAILDAATEWSNAKVLLKKI